MTYTVKRSRSDAIVDAVIFATLTLVVLVVLYPLYFVVIGSISDPDAIYQGRAWLIPGDITFEGYQRMFRDNSIWLGYWNTIIYTGVGTAINVLVTLPAAYALSRRDLAGRGFIAFAFTFTMLFNGGLIPTFLVVHKLGMYNTIWSMVLPNAVMIYYLIIARTFFQETLPIELLDSAMIDGCSNFQFFMKIALPLSGALIAIMVLFHAVAHWNTFFNALIYLQDEKKYPLQLVLRNILIANQVSDGMMDDIASIARQQRIADLIKYGVIIVSSAPMLILYPFLQKYFVKGVMIGAVKG